MGIGKKVATRKGKKIVENTTEGIPVVGDIVDDNIKSGPMDRAEDGIGNAKDNLVGGKKKGPASKKR